MKIYFMFFLLLASLHLKAEEALSVRFPNRLITPDYGIVTASDLTFDAKRRDAIPYNPNNFSSALYWQCLPVKEVTAKYRTWKGEDGMGPSNVRQTMCEFELLVEHNGDTQIYSGRRAYPVAYCREIIRHWYKITKGESIVCMDGEGGEYSQNNDGVGYKSWTLDKIKTKVGCYSYFDGDCQ